jgi:GT2 family glycosyltransferase/glycosyltransferase involved in cell wall biosynthesis
MSLEAVPDAGGGASRNVIEGVLASSRRHLPSGPALLAFDVVGGWPGTLQLFAEDPGAGGSVLVHEFEIPAVGGRVEHLISIGASVERLSVRYVGKAPPPVIESIRIRELGSVPLTALLTTRWIRRQLREPRRAGEKLANLLRVVRRGGLRAALEGVVASQIARQGTSEQSRLRPELKPGFAYTGVWAKERYPPAPTTKEAYDHECARQLRSFLGSSERLPLPSASTPTLSIVLVTYNRADLSLACLRSIIANAPPDAEVVIVDNASSDDTPSLLRRMDGGTVIENLTNLGFLRACNQGVAYSAGRFLLLLNNDAVLLPGSVEAAIRTLEIDSGTGVVGGRLIGLDGDLQAAGSIIWSDGRCSGYGRGAHPNAPEYRYRREVDYVSGAFLLTRRDLWERLGGFNEVLAPAYYEDTDFCVRAHKVGSRVVYEPEAAVVHYEYASSSGPDAAVAAMVRNQGVFATLHADWLRGRPSAAASPLMGRSADPGRRRILVIDDRIPASEMGSGFPRTTAILRGLVALDFEVTFYPMQPFLDGWSQVREIVPPEVEVMLGWGQGQLGAFLADRSGHYHSVLVSRAHNMEVMNECLRREPRLLGGADLVYDAEALAATRRVLERELEGDPLPGEQARRLLEDEIRVAARADRVTSVSASEMRAFREGGAAEVHRLAHGIDPSPTTRPFGDRRNLLFIGRVSEEDSPNVDALVWFIDHVLPILRTELAAEGPPDLVIVGRTGSTALAVRGGQGVRLVGAVEELSPAYDEARLFVAPHRFSAGIPIKIVEAAAHGVPVVTSQLLCDQLGWGPGRDLLSSPVGDAEAFGRHCATLYRDQALWQRLRENALARVAEEFSTERFVGELDRALAQRR